MPPFSVNSNDQHLPYFELPLSSLKKQIDLDVGAALKDAGLDIGMLTGGGGGGGGGGGDGGIS